MKTNTTGMVVRMLLFNMLVCGNVQAKPGVTDHEPDLFIMPDSTTPNNCDDSRVRRQWAQAIKQYPEDSQLRYLHELRITLCGRVDRGSISLDKATREFESERDRIIWERRQAPETSE